MTHIRTSILAAAVCLGLAAPALAQQECGGVRMPERMNVGGTELVLNGMGIREATVLNVDVYVAGLYLENRSRDANRILDQGQTKHMVLKLVRDVSREEMVDAVTEGIRNNAGEDYAQMREQTRQLARLIPALDEGDTITFTYAPAQEGLSVVVNGQRRGTVEGADFARVFYMIWLGDAPPNPGLKRGLLGGGC